MIEIPKCDSCSTDEFLDYMVKDALWLSVAKPREVLCLKCFEARLGRKVQLLDLKPCPLTYDMFLGAYIAGNTAEPPPEQVLLYAQGYVVDRREFKW